MEIEDSEHLLEWTSAYKNFNFNLPKTIDLNANYIIQDKDTDYLELLRKNHFDMVQTGHYYVCTSPWESYDTNNDILEYTWNSGINEQGILDTSAATDVQGTPSLVLVGWAFNSADASCFDDMFLVADTHTYRPEIVERADVVDSNGGNEELLNSGLLFIIPQSELQNIHSAKLVCIDSDTKTKAELQIQIQ